jgi:hypothetical protein
MQSVVRTLLLVTITLPLALPSKAANYCFRGTPASAIDLSTRTVPEQNKRDFSFLKAIRTLGVKTIIRYYSFDDANGHTKTMRRYERDAISQHGLAIAVVFQHHNNDWTKFRDHAVGTRDAKRALKLAWENAQPRGSAIYFGVDFDPRNGTAPSERARIAANLRNVREYFDRIGEQFDGQGFRVGVYGSGVVCDALISKHKAQLCWLSQSYGFPGTRERIRAGRYDLLQLYPTQECLGRSVDFNKTGSQSGDFGQFRAYARQ